MSEDTKTEVELVDKIIEDVEKRLESIEETFDVPVQIGHRVRCKITGYRGIVTVKVYNLYRVPQFHVQSKMNGGSVGNSVMFDEVQLEVMEEKPVITIVEPTEWKFQLGEKVLDSVTKYKGTVVSRELHMNSCIRYKVCNEFIPGDKTSMRVATFDEGSLVKITKTPEERVEVPVNPASPNRGCAMGFAENILAY